MMNIAKLSEFDSKDRQRAILFLAWQAREYLSDAENREEVQISTRRVLCSEAAALLEAGRMLLEREPGRTAASNLMDRSLASAKAAVENGIIAALYQQSVSRPKSPEWDKQRTPKAISIFKRAAETARQETHRALVELCEMFGDVMPTEER